MFATVTKTVGLKGDHMTFIRYSLTPGSNVIIGRVFAYSHNLAEPSEEQLRKSLLMNGEHEIDVHGP